MYFSEFTPILHTLIDAIINLAFTSMNRPPRARRLLFYAPLLVTACVVVCRFPGGYTMARSALPAITQLLAPHQRQPMCRSPALLSRLEVPATQMVRDATAVAERIKEEAWSTQEEVPTAVLLLSDSKYELRFEEMIKTWSEFASKGSLVMAALDDATDVYFRSRGIKTIRVMPDDMSPERSMREAVLQTKVVIPYVFLLKEVRVVMVEMDIFCRSNPLRLDSGTADIIVAEHNYCEEVNVGFWIAYPTCPAIDSFRRMQAWVRNPGRTHAYCDGAFDQKLIHFAWLGHGALSANSSSPCHDFSQRDQIFDPRANTPVALERISYHDMMHWAPPWDPRPDPETWPRTSSQPVCVHIWSAFGSPPDQIQYGYRRGWFPNGSERAAKYALKEGMREASNKHVRVEFEQDFPETGVSITQVLAQPPFFYAYISKDSDSFQVADSAIRALEPGLSALWIDRTRECCEQQGRVIDVGGHFGYYSLLSAAMGCSFTAFEPVPTFSSVFQLNMRMNGLVGPNNRLVSAAVGGKRGEVDMIVPTSGVLGLAHVKGRHQDESKAASDLTVTVPVLALDDVVSAADDAPICAMKVDVEGLEPDVIDGARALLSGGRVPYIMLEFSPGYKTEGLEKMLTDLHAWGYKAMEVDWKLAKIGESLLEVDVASLFGPTLMRNISTVEARKQLIQSVSINTNVWFYLH